MVTDFRKLNEVTVGNSYPLPLMVNIIDTVANAKYITAIDLRSGFYQIPMDPADAKKMAFEGPCGYYGYVRIGMGLTSAPATFQGLIDLVLKGLQGSDMYVYLDDIIILADTLEEHCRKFRKLTKRLAKANPTLKPAKCQFLQRKAKVLGHIVGNGNIFPDPSNIEGIKKFPVPTTVKKMKQFLGMAGYYRHFVEKFAKIAHPLMTITRQNPAKGRSVLGNEQQEDPRKSEISFAQSR